MDGIEKLRGVFIIGATSQPEILDPSLVRPGRFELGIKLALPDRKERQEIFGIHLRAKPLAPEVTLEWLADQTEGWNGSQIEAFCRRAALAWFREGVEQGWPEDREYLLNREQFQAEFSKG
jgi:transitional endoplasmic reticulum ATPase